MLPGDDRMRVSRISEKEMRGEVRMGSYSFLLTARLYPGLAFSVLIRASHSIREWGETLFLAELRELWEYARDERSDV